MDRNDRELAQAAYREMYRAMIQKDRAGMDAVLDDSFVLIHMTGMRQGKQDFIRAVTDGTLNYFSVAHENMPVELSGDTAVLSGQSVVSAAVFGGGCHTWRLQQKCSMKKTEDGWKITQSVASTW